MRLSVVATMLCVASAAPTGCYVKNENACKGEQAACVWNFVHSCCSDRQGPVCNSHMYGYVHHVYPHGVVRPTTINDAQTGQPLSHGPPVVVHPAHPHVPVPGIPTVYHPHPTPLVYSHDKKNSKLRGKN